MQGGRPYSKLNLHKLKKKLYLAGFKWTKKSVTFKVLSGDFWAANQIQLAARKSVLSLQRKSKAIAQRKTKFDHGLVKNTQVQHRLDMGISHGPQQLFETLAL